MTRLSAVLAVLLAVLLLLGPMIGCAAREEDPNYSRNPGYNSTGYEGSSP